MRSSPRVMADPGCATTVDMLKKGPSNIPQVLKEGAQLGFKFSDPTFAGLNALYWTDYSTEA